MRTLIRSQRELIDAIVRLTNERNIPPSIRELADVLGVTPHAIFERLECLHRKGAVTWEPGRRRTVRALMQVYDGGTYYVIG